MNSNLGNHSPIDERASVCRFKGDLSPPEGIALYSPTEEILKEKLATSPYQRQSSFSPPVNYLLHSSPRPPPPSAAKILGTPNTVLRKRRVFSQHGPHSMIEISKDSPSSVQANKHYDETNKQDTIFHDKYSFSPVTRETASMQCLSIRSPSIAKSAAVSSFSSYGNKLQSIGKVAHTLISNESLVNFSPAPRQVPLTLINSSVHSESVLKTPLSQINNNDCRDHMILSPPVSQEDHRNRKLGIFSSTTAESSGIFLSPRMHASSPRLAVQPRPSNMSSPSESSKGISYVKDDVNNIPKEQQRMLGFVSLPRCLNEAATTSPFDDVMKKQDCYSKTTYCGLLDVPDQSIGHGELKKMNNEMDYLLRGFTREKKPFPIVTESTVIPAPTNFSHDHSAYSSTVADYLGREGSFDSTENNIMIGSNEMPSSKLGKSANPPVEIVSLNDSSKTNNLRGVNTWNEEQLERVPMVKSLFQPTSNLSNEKLDAFVNNDDSLPYDSNESISDSDDEYYTNKNFLLGSPNAFMIKNQESSVYVTEDTKSDKQDDREIKNKLTRMLHFRYGLSDNQCGFKAKLSHADFNSDSDLFGMDVIYENSASQGSLFDSAERGNTKKSKVNNQLGELRSAHLCGLNRAQSEQSLGSLGLNVQEQQVLLHSNSRDLITPPIFRQEILSPPPIKETYLNAKNLRSA